MPFPRLSSPQRRHLFLCSKSSKQAVRLRILLGAAVFHVLAIVFILVMFLGGTGSIHDTFILTFSSRLAVKTANDHVLPILFSAFVYLNNICLRMETPANTDLCIPGEPARLLTWTTVIDAYETFVDAHVAYNKTSGYYDAQFPSTWDRRSPNVARDQLSSSFDSAFPVQAFATLLLGMLLSALAWVLFLLLELWSRIRALNDRARSIALALFSMAVAMLLIGAAISTAGVRNVADLANTSLPSLKYPATFNSPAYIGQSLITLVWCAFVCELLGTLLLGGAERLRKSIYKSTDSQANSLSPAATREGVQLSRIQSARHGEPDAGLDDGPPPYEIRDPLDPPPPSVEAWDQGAEDLNDQRLREEPERAPAYVERGVFEAHINH